MKHHSHVPHTLSHHYLVMMTNISDAQRLIVTTALKTRLGTDWYNYFPDVWLVCSTYQRGDFATYLASWFTEPQAFYQVLELDKNSAVFGMMPEEAWVWLRRHGLM